jgi:hypothetical protein
MVTAGVVFSCQIGPQIRGAGNKPQAALSKR